MISFDKSKSYQAALFAFCPAFCTVHQWNSVIFNHLKVHMWVNCVTAFWVLACGILVCMHYLKCWLFFTHDFSNLCTDKLLFAIIACCSWIAFVSGHVCALWGDMLSMNLLPVSSKPKILSGILGACTPVLSSVMKFWFYPNTWWRNLCDSSEVR